MLISIREYSRGAMHMHAAGVGRRQGGLQDGERGDQADRVHEAGDQLLANRGRRHSPREFIADQFYVSTQ